LIGKVARSVRGLLFGPDQRPMACHLQMVRRRTSRGPDRGLSLIGRIERMRARRRECP
jgi:hypothetical protein